VELQILHVLWEKGSATVREVHAVLSKRRKLAYTSVLSMLQFMEGKGLVSHEREGRAYRYRATRARRQTLRRLVGDIVKRGFSGSPTLLIQHLIEHENIPADELRRLRELIAEKEKGEGGNES